MHVTIRIGDKKGPLTETRMENTNGSMETGRGKAAGSRVTQFQPGHAGKKNGVKRKGYQLSRLLRDMRAVYEQDESKDRTPGQVLCRKVLKEQPAEFIRQLSGLEKAHITRVEKERKAAAVEEEEDPDEFKGDEGRRRLDALAKKMFDEFEREMEEKERQFVREGRCVTCGQPPIPGIGRAGKALGSILDREARHRAYQARQQELDE